MLKIANIRPCLFQVTSALQPEKEKGQHVQWLAVIPRAVKVRLRLCSLLILVYAEATHEESARKSLSEASERDWASPMCPMTPTR